MERILDDIRESVSNGLCRQHLVTRQDLHNIKAQYNIDGIVRHKNDLTNVRVWVQEMSTLEYNPVLIFKPQGESKDNFTENDFLLVLQTEFQRDMFQRFCSVAVCVDATHGTNAYDFYLTTVMVIDDYGEGIPVGWMVSNNLK